MTCRSTLAAGTVPIPTLPSSSKVKWTVLVPPSEDLVPHCSLPLESIAWSHITVPVLDCLIADLAELSPLKWSLALGSLCPKPK